ncbi:protein eva-1-like isoform X1 [Daphnia carinata]|uniref:protein eva-1-like isoform X1 n=1 Tax=Daphnia carinata TaxID=120202 RepID=UPI00257DF07D|nr:protein eva-1-like isoform X1 [Daphnia carinata]
MLIELQCANWTVKHGRSSAVNPAGRMGHPSGGCITPWLLLFLLAASSSNADNLALLSGTLRTIQRAACDGETLTLRCPLGTAVSIQLAQYGRPAPGVALCSQQQHPPDPPALTAVDGNQLQQNANNDTCTLTPQMQHALLQTVVEACMKKRHCKFTTSPSNSKDTAVVVPASPSCPGQPPKFVEVAYKCRPLEFRSKIICENETIQLKCKRNARIAIYSATFGRVQFQSAQCLQPPGVDDETCEASFSTETVMQMCHGKRRCTLNASSSTFGNPCSPQSHLYLRVVYTCVSRKILKDHYQGELEDDEVPDHQTSFDNEDLMSENSFESEDYAEPVSSATSIPPRHVAAQDDASNYDQANNYRTTDRPFGDQQAKRGGFIGDAGVVVDVDDMLGDIGSDGGGGHRDSRRRQEWPQPSDRDSNAARGNGLDIQANSSQQNVFGFITDWITSVSFMKENQEKFILYLTLSIAAGILVVLTLLIARMWWQKRRGRREAKSLHSSDPIPAFADDVSDVDNDIDLTSLSLPPPPPLLSELTSLNGTMTTGPVPSAEGVYSTQYGYSGQHGGVGTIRRSTVEEGDTHPRSFIRNGNNSHYYYG